MNGLDPMSVIAHEGEMEREARGRVDIALGMRLATVRPFTDRAASAEELHERLAAVAPQVREIAAAACDDHHYDGDRTEVVEAAFAMLRDSAAPPPLADEDDEEEDDEGKPPAPFSTPDSFGPGHRIGSDGDGCQQERVSLPAGDGEYGGPSPKIDKGEWNSGQLGETAEPLGDPAPKSKRHPSEMQDADAVPTDAGWQRFDPVDTLTERVDADKPIGDTQAIHTDTWSDGQGGSAGQANPVTVEAKYTLVAE